MSTDHLSANTLMVKHFSVMGMAVLWLSCIALHRNTRRPRAWEEHPGGGRADGCVWGRKRRRDPEAKQS